LKHIIIYSETDLAKDPRVYRQIEALSKKYKITAIGCGYPTGIDCTYIDITSYLFKKTGGKNKIEKLKNSISVNGFFKAFLFLGIYLLKKTTGQPLFFYWLDVLPGRRKITKLVKNINSDLIIANDFSGLLTVIPLLKKRSVLYDAHEYTPGQINLTSATKNTIKYYNYILKKYLNRVMHVITVADGIAREYAEKFNVVQPDVITNSTTHVQLNPSSRVNTPIRLVHHGIALKRRKIELLINAVELLDEKFTLDLYLVRSEKDYLIKLKEMISENKRIIIHEPMDPNNMVQGLNKYDIGLYILPPDNFNHKHALPNKIFEFIQARLGVAIGPSTEMAKYVNDYELGVVSTDFTPEAMASVLSKLTIKDINKFKENSNKYAYELSAKPQMEKLNIIVANLLN